MAMAPPGETEEAGSCAPEGIFAFVAINAAPSVETHLQPTASGTPAGACHHSKAAASCVAELLGPSPCKRAVTSHLHRKPSQAVGFAEMRE